jgi:hypothetical protein
MAAVPGYTRIVIGGHDELFINTIQMMIKTIAKTATGNDLLRHIETNPSQNFVSIFKSSGGNVTQVVNQNMGDQDKPFVKLRIAVRDLHGNDADQTKRKAVSDEIEACLARAGARGHGKDQIARRLGGYGTAILGTTTHANRDIRQNAKAHRLPSDQMSDLLDDLCDPDGNWGYNDLKEGSGAYSLGDRLCQVMRPYLRSGPGQHSQIKLNPDVEQSCVGDGQMRKRPVIIGLYHELVHAYRNVRGRRVFDDFMSCNMPDDELMTTGITPYAHTRFSENKFRAEVNVENRPGYR